MGSRENWSLRAPRKTREEVIARASTPPSRWPTPSEDQLTMLDKLNLLKAYVALKQAVEYYVEGRKGQFIEAQTGVNITKAKRLFEAYIAPRHDGSIPGFYACLPGDTQAPGNKHSRDPEKSPFNPELEAQGRGLKGRFKALLNAKNGRMRKLLDDFFRTRSLNGRAPTPVLTQSIVFKGFLQLCEDEGIGKDEWPLNRKRKGEWAITNSTLAGQWTTSSARAHAKSRKSTWPPPTASSCLPCRDRTHTRGSNLTSICCTPLAYCECHAAAGHLSLWAPGGSGPSSCGKPPPAPFSPPASPTGRSTTRTTFCGSHDAH